jgi:transposase-like protein
MEDIRPEGKTGCVYCRKITYFKKDTIYPIIESTVSENAKVVTDEYPSYNRLKKNSAKTNS